MANSTVCSNRKSPYKPVHRIEVFIWNRLVGAVAAVRMRPYAVQRDAERSLTPVFRAEPAQRSGVAAAAGDVPVGGSGANS